MIGVETVATLVYSSFKLMGVVRIISVALARSSLKQWSVTLRVDGIILLSSPGFNKVNIPFEK